MGTSDALERGVESRVGENALPGQHVPLELRRNHSLAVEFTNRLYSAGAEADTSARLDLAAPDTAAQGSWETLGGYSIVPQFSRLTASLCLGRTCAGAQWVWGVACGMNFSSLLSSCRAL